MPYLTFFHLSCFLCSHFILLSLSVIGQNKIKEDRRLLHAESINKSNFSEIWQKGCAFTTEVAALMPEEEYDYSPQDDILSFRTQLLHIVDNIRGLRTFNFPEDKKELERVSQKEWTKDQTIELLKESCLQIEKDMDQLTDDQLGEAVSFWTEDKVTRFGILLLIRDHMTHHRSQLILFLKLKGIEPPKYVGW